MQRAHDGEVRQVIIQNVIVEGLFKGERRPECRRPEDAAECLLYGRQTVQPDV